MHMTAVSYLLSEDGVNYVWEHKKNLKLNYLY